MAGQVLLGNVMLALTPTTIYDGNLVSFGEATDSTAEPTGHPHQMGVVQLLVGAVHQTPPPLTEATSRVAQRVVGVQNDSIDTVKAPLQQVAVPLRQLIGHCTTVD
jgi:hypothetical protein